MSEKTAPDGSGAAWAARPEDRPAPRAAPRRSSGGLSLRVRLLLLVALAIAPAIVAGAFNAVTRYESGMIESRTSLRALSILAVNRHLETLAETNRLLQTVAKLPEVVRFDTGACPLVVRQLHRELAQRYTNITVVDRDGVIRCSAQDIGAGLSYSDLGHLKTVIEGNAFTVGTVRTGPVSGERVLTAGAPVGTSGQAPVGAVITGLRADFLNSLFDQYQLPDGSQFALVDRTGESLAGRSSDTWRLPSTDTLRQAIAANRTEFAHSAGGLDYLVVLNRIGDYDIHALTALPAASALSKVNSRLFADMAQVFVFLVLAIVGVLVGARLMVLQPIRRFHGAVRAYRRDGGASFDFDARGAPPEIVELADEFRTMAHDVEARQEKLRALVSQRDLLVRETNHRVKNNLQIVASLLSLQSRRIAEPAAKAQFDLARQRVATLALLHRHLYEQRDTETVNLNTFFTQLMAQLASAFGHRAETAVAVPDMRVPPSVAIPLGLIVTEAVTNAMKYAFPDGRRGRISLEVSVADGRGRLMLTDNGVGMAKDAASASGIGDVLMRGFAEQVSGTLKVEPAPGGGTRLDLDFQLEEPPERGDGEALIDGGT